MRQPIETILIASLCATSLLSANQASAHDNKDRSSLPRAMGQPESFSGSCAEAKSGSRSAKVMIGAVVLRLASRALAASSDQPEGIVVGAVFRALVRSQINGSYDTCPAEQTAEKAFAPEVESEMRPHTGALPRAEPVLAPSSRRAVGGDWYQPSPHSYYGRERREPLRTAPADIPRPTEVLRDFYVGQTGPATGGMHPSGHKPTPCMVCTR